MPGRQEHSIIDEQRTVDHASDKMGPGDVTATVIDYDPDWVTGAGDPAEWALVRLRFVPAASPTQQVDQYAALVLKHRLRRSPAAKHPRWVFEAMSYDTDPEGNPIRSPDGELYQAINVRLPSSDADLTMGKLLDRLVGKAHFYF